MRLARATDADAIWPLLRDVFRASETYAVDPQISKDAALNYWMTQPRAVYVAEENGQIRGTYYIKTNQPGGGAHICNCGYIVAPEARGRGLAALMCAHSQDEARHLGYKAMQFNFVLASNEGAIRLWHRLGFETIGTIHEAFDHPQLGFVDAHIMYKSLAKIGPSAK
ncbi:GNAT family N-acetyltransferase [Cognatiyoonia sp. IB215446]|uniref:GNAT family N-acetyltransferase n=1 Tax=Cognatiyoonia sp. IB215446 TaxID=3097355 RepID=UPI002A0DBB2F|nr:GNAT family N-acetyltransferase [Cognatiyoonia sp. IB215446]MDX8348341.1 GNAT family N-acetyltransferase [Cognatiyoonia sp. IB215446]